jgi:hypothetical protein
MKKAALVALVVVVIGSTLIFWNNGNFSGMREVGRDHLRKFAFVRHWNPTKTSKEPLPDDSAFERNSSNQKPH